MQMPDYDEFFRAYADFYNGALAEKPVILGLVPRIYGSLPS